MRKAGTSMDELSKDNLLRSWKDIAAYLGCDVRTCHRWETSHGLPVHRAEGVVARSTVFAYKDELDAWFKETFKNSHAQEKPRAAARPAGRRPPWAVIGAACLIAAGALLYFLLLRPPGQPADFRIEGSVLVILDGKGREIWRKDMSVEDLQTESFYREHFQLKNTSAPTVLPLLIMKDIDADGNTEVLFALRRRSDSKGEGILFCFDRYGNERWEYVCQRELHSPNKIFPADYRIYGVVCYDIEGDGRLEIFVISYHAPDWPCQLAVLDPSSGKTIGEFWNAGNLKDILFHDLDGDGREEMIVSGVNNEYKGGCLIVFDPRRVSGGSPQSGDFVLGGIAPGSMLYYVTTPYTDVSLAKREAVDYLGGLGITKNGWIEAITGVGVFYDFGFDLRCVQVYCGHSFQMDHKALRQAGTITSVLDDNYVKTLKDGVRWWDGHAWSAGPTPVKR
jgi:hypothetical protein